MSAIHNEYRAFTACRLIVSDVQRYKICQQFTTFFIVVIFILTLFQTCKDTKFVSNSQLLSDSTQNEKNCFRRAKIQNLSAIHNGFLFIQSYTVIVSDVQRYKICQQFTTTTEMLSAYNYCFRRAKIQNLSAIHNRVGNHQCRCILFQTCKDTKFVSNSQRQFVFQIQHLNCFRRAKIQNLSAIHN